MQIHGIDIASVNTLVCSDRVSVYACDAVGGDGRITCDLPSSWRGALVPRLVRQAWGRPLTDAHGAIVGERPLVVLAWNGSNHYDVVAIPRMDE